MKLRIAGLVGESIVDGPGFRFTVFTQGCPHNCEGCHNPQTHDFNGGYDIDTDEIYEKIIKDPLLDGVTFSGGDPFCQCKPLAELAKKIHEFDGFKLNVIAYTGYTYEYLVSHADEENGYMELLEQCDYLIDGRFVLSQRSLELKFRGSRNQRFIDVKKSLQKGEAVALDDEALSLM
ncbi:MAG: anaerobic ribonucleoside-triphosphate reductase activating protein [Oscillospiraceae bacterium]